LHLNQASFDNDGLFKTYKSYFSSPFPEKSILKAHSEMTEE